MIEKDLHKNAPPSLLQSYGRIRKMALSTMPTKEYLAIFALIFIYATSALLTREFGDFIKGYLDFGFLGMAIYILAATVETVIAPISTIPLIPVASALWGPFTTALLTIFAWSLGSIIAFGIARRYGKPFIARFVNIKSVEQFEKVLSGKYLFLNILFLRMAVPFDFFSYAVGLFSSIPLGHYILATVVGITPFILILSYASEGSLFLQIVSGLLVIAGLYLGYRKVKKKSQEGL